MAEAKTAVANKPTWVDLSTTDASAAREFYSKLFGWKIEVDPDPQYGGYGMAEAGGKKAAGNWPQKSPGAPAPRAIYIPPPYIHGPAQKGQGPGGEGGGPPLDGGEQGRAAAPP